MAAEGVGVTAGARQRRQLRLRTQTLRAELDAIEGGVAGARPCQTLAHGLVGVRPAAFPEGELDGDGVVGARAALVLAHGGERGLEVGPRGVEVAAAGLELGAQDQRLVRPVGGVRAQRRGADAVGVLPLAGRDQGFDVVGEERAVLDAVAAG